MPIEHVLDQGKPKPSSTLRAAVSHVDPIKSLGQAWQVFRRDAGPIIAYRHPRLG